jgi:hypothetical protein
MINYSMFSQTRFDYYYNNVPGKGLCRNNLVYTSLISEDKKIFCQWYYNDRQYHLDQNQVIDPELMEQKWNREIKFLSLMSLSFPELVPSILDIDHKNKKIYLEIDGVDFWQRSLDADCAFDQILPNWQDQMIEILKAHKVLGLYKYSMHPSSYFIVNGQLKSINYFFTYHKDEGAVKIKDHVSHIYSTRQESMRQYAENNGISWTEPESQDKIEQLTWESFRTNYPDDFISRAKCIK